MYDSNYETSCKSDDMSSMSASGTAVLYILTPKNTMNRSLYLNLPEDKNLKDVQFMLIDV